MNKRKSERVRKNDLIPVAVFKKCGEQAWVNVMRSLIVCFAAVAFSNTALALKIDDWEQTCMAPNWKTGKIEPVEEARVMYRRTYAWIAKTDRLPDGKWRITFNTYGEKINRLSPDARKFIFYHECAHARLNTPDERVADCVGLRLMRKDMQVTPKIIDEIKFSYLHINRTFPTGGPCDDLAAPDAKN